MPAAGPGENGKTESWAGFQYTDGGIVGGQRVDLDEFIPAIIIPEWCYGAPAAVPQPAPSASTSGNSMVKAYQHKLNVLNIRDDSGQPIAEDGINGPRTKQEIVRLEELMGLTVGTAASGASSAKVLTIRSPAPSRRCSWAATETTSNTCNISSEVLRSTVYSELRRSLRCVRISPRTA